MELVKYNNNSISNVTSVGLTSGDLNLLATNTITSGVSSSSFTSSIDITYDTYIFKFINIHPSANGENFGFQADTGTNTNYNQTITSTFFEATHGEDGSGGALSYKTAKDQAQGTGLQSLGQPNNNDDASISGTLHLFAPSNDIFVKHIIARANLNESSTQSANFIGGYINTATAITRVQFKFSSGNIDSGVIKMYGLSKS